jgi:hypothetical protein
MGVTPCGDNRLARDGMDRNLRRGRARRAADGTALGWLRPPLSSSAKVGVGTKKTTGPHDHSTTAACLAACHIPSRLRLAVWPGGVGGEAARFIGKLANPASPVASTIPSGVAEGGFVLLGRAPCAGNVTAPGSQRIGDAHCQPTARWVVR